ncbi:MAG: Gfo/Idh/MocA family oxidoreductase [Planctomycetota bacterium]
MVIEQPSESSPGPSRRDFLLAASAAFAVAGCSGGPARRDRNSRLRIAQIGCNGKGLSDMRACAKEHDIVALCDIDEQRAGPARAEHPNAKFHFDYRDLLDREKLDAVVVSTPDHSHALPALIAMQLGYHVFVQKPLAHTVEEVRLLKETARRTGAITSMGNQGTCLDGFREAAEIVRSGGIGEVREVHVWTDRCSRWWAQGIPRPDWIDPIPASLRWDLFLGSAPWRPFAAARKGKAFQGYTPFHWRGFWDFGTGALGDMACHVANLACFALDLWDPEWIEADTTEVNEETAPLQSTIRYHFPARGGRGEVDLTWYDGGRLPPAALLPGVQWRQGGFLLVGSEGMLYSPTDYGEKYELHPREKFREYEKPAPFLPRSKGIHEEWLEGILEGRQPMASFDYAARLAETVLLGNVAIRAGQRIEWDAAAMRAKNLSDAERFLRKEYRRGFELPRGA